MRNFNRTTRLLGRVALGCSLITSMAACGAAGGYTAATTVDNDVTQPDSPLQSSLSAANNSLAVSEADTGSQAAPDGAGTSSPSAMAELRAACVAVTTNPSPLDPNNLPLQYSIAWTYTDCMRSLRGGSLNGTRSVSVTRDPNDHTSDIDSSFALTSDYLIGTQLVADGNVTIDSNGLRSAGSVTRTVTGDGNRVFTRASGKELYNHTYSHQLSVADSYVASSSDPNAFVLSQRVINGSGQLNHNLIDAVSQTTFTNITYQPATCGWPVSGTLAVVTTYKKGNVDSETYTWSTPCGTLSYSGQTTTLTDAP